MLIIEDGSQQDCRSIVESYHSQLSLSYYFKPNTGPGDSRNYGMEKAQGDYFIFFDSDCIIPENYLVEVEKALQMHPLDAYGGPDRAHESFTPIQRAINYAMTSFLTTGGIRGRKQPLDTFQPRSFNMGIARQVYEQVEGFSEIHPGEDPDLSYRIQQAGFKTGLIHRAWVYHKRRIDLGKFRVQVYKFGLARSILMKWHPQSTKWVYWLPTLATLGALALAIGGVYFTPAWWMLALGAIIIFLDALFKNGNLWIALQALVATGVQIVGYGWGFLKGIWFLHVLRRDERTQFPAMFFNNN